MRDKKTERKNQKTVLKLLSDQRAFDLRIRKPKSFKGGYILGFGSA